MAVLIVFEGLGRWAYARGVPDLLEISGSMDANAYAREGQRYFERAKYDLAAAYAETALHRAPLHQKSFRTLGLSQVARGQEEAGRRTMQAAGRLGWHDVATQTWLMWDALQRGDTRYALLRADALARRGTMATGLFKVLAAFGVEPRSRALLMERLHTASGWRSEFFRFSTAATLAEAQTAESLLRELSRGPNPPTRPEIAPIVRRLAALGEYDRAARLSSDLLKTPRAGEVVSDGEFRQFDVYGERSLFRTPFEWEFGSTPGATAVVERPEDPADGALYVETNGSRNEVLLAGKVVRASPGSRTLGYTIRSSDRTAPERFQWALTCLSDGSQLIGPQTADPLPSAQAQQRSIAFTVPADCPFQQLRLVSRRADERGTLSAYFDKVSIR